MGNGRDYVDSEGKHREVEFQNETYRCQRREAQLVPEERTKIRQVVNIETRVDQDGCGDNIAPYIAACYDLGVSSTVTPEITSIECILILEHGRDHK